MHTALQLDVAHFRVTRLDMPASREDILPNWSPSDRLGIVVTEPFGAVGASHLIQLSITSFYDVRPDRRAAKPRSEDPRAVYPEIYLFHVGGPHGDHSAYDFWPARKEVHVDGDPRSVLDAINDRAITRLLVPDSDPVPVEHQWKEPAAARDRIVSALAYSPTGRVRSPEWRLTGLRGSTESNVERVLDPTKRYASKAATSSPTDSFVEDPVRSWPVRARARIDEASHGLEVAQRRRQAILDDGLATESYRTITLDDALHMLVGVPDSQN
jgi:hypothetical protein